MLVCGAIVLKQNSTHEEVSNTASMILNRFYLHSLQEEFKLITELESYSLTYF